MPARNFKAKVTLSVDQSQLSTGLAKARKSLGSFSRQANSLGRSFTTNLTAPILAFGAVSLRAWDKQAKAIAQVEAGIRSTGSAAGFTSKQLQKMAADLQNKTLFGDEEILKGATAQLLTFTNIANRQFARTQKAALDLATRLDGDLKSASIQLGKALNDPIANLSALSRSGIQFSQEQKTLVKSLAETGRLAEAQTIILDELEKQYGGSAEAAAKAGLGGFKQLQNTLGDIAEGFGKVINEALVPIQSKLREVADRFGELSDQAKKKILIIAGLFAAGGPLLLALSVAASAISALLTPVGLVVAGVAVAAAAIIKNWDQISTYFTTGDGAEAFMKLKEVGSRVFSSLKKTIVTFIETVRRLWSQYGDHILKVAEFAFESVVAVVTFALDRVNTTMKKFNGDFDSELNIFEDNILTTLDKIDAKLIKFAKGVLPTFFMALKKGFAPALKLTGLIPSDKELRSFHNATNELIKERERITRAFGRRSDKNGILDDFEEVSNSILAQLQGVSIDIPIRPFVDNPRPVDELIDNMKEIEQTLGLAVETMEEELTDFVDLFEGTLVSGIDAMATSFGALFGNIGTGISSLSDIIKEFGKTAKKILNDLIQQLIRITLLNAALDIFGRGSGIGGLILGIPGFIDFSPNAGGIKSSAGGVTSSRAESRGVTLTSNLFLDGNIVYTNQQDVDFTKRV